MNTIDKHIYENLNLLPEDLQGWNGHAPIFKEFIEKIKPTHIIEVGTWKGMSAINMAKTVKDLSLDTKITCVDTWLGALEFWSKNSQTPDRNLLLKNGYPQIYYQFLSNVVHNKVEDIITPFPITSLIAARYFIQNNIKADLIYIDGSHDFEDVYYDVNYYYRILNNKGIIFGDDIHSPILRDALKKACDDLKVEYKTFDKESPNYNFWYINK